ncbi:MAG: esterase-like activity of phytase family protein [Planctomycetota bacterium]
MPHARSWGSAGAAALAAASVLIGTVSASEPASDIELRLIGEHHIEPRAEFLGTRIGGLSGIDYEPNWGFMIALSDDKGEHAPPRAYLAEIELAPDRIVGLEWMNVLKMHWGSGELIDVALDPEGIRFVPHGEKFGEPTLLFVSEGDARRGVEPRIYEMCSGATRMDEWPAPRSHVPTGRRSRVGVHDNRAFESVAVVGDRRAVVGTERPLRQDGGRYVRLSTYDLREPLADAVSQVAYPLGAPGAALASPAVGLVDLLALEGGRLLAVERSLRLTGGYSVELYIIDPAGATDVLDAPTLDDGGFTPARKTPVASLSDLAPTVLNVEGVCFGPRLADGTATLLFVSDSNFAPGLPTVLTALAIEDDGGVLRPVTIEFAHGRPAGPAGRPEHAGS